MTTIAIEIAAERAQIITPYNPAFVSDLKTSFGRNARWNAEAKTWSVPASDVDKARSLVREHFGTDGSQDPGPTVTVRWTAVTDITAAKKPVMRYGRPIVSASGRDTGARPEEGVTLESGVVTSGGSRNNWQTIVRAGAVLTIHDVPLALAQADPEAIIVEADTHEAQTLRARLADLDRERAAIVARLADLGEAEVN